MIDILFFDIMKKFVSAEGKITLVQPLAGQGYLAAYLEKEGFSTKIHHIFVKGKGVFKLNKEEKLIAIDIEELLLEENPRIVAFGPTTPYYKGTIRVQKMVKKILPKTTTCIGNIHATAFPDQAIKDGFDYVFLKDGFTTFPKFVKNFLSNRQISERIIKPDKTLADLDKIPFISKAFYEDLKPFVHGIPFGILSTSFACIHHCKYCATPNFIGSHWVSMSPQRIIDEIKYQVENWGFKIFSLTDPNVIPNKALAKRFLELNRLIDKEGLEIEFYINMIKPKAIADIEREDPAYLDEVLRYIRFTIVEIDFLNKKALDEYNKNHDYDSIIIALEALNKRGVMVVPHLCLGGFSDNHESIRDMINFINKIKPFKVGGAILVPLPYTKLYDEMEKKNLLLTKDWDLYDYTHLVFKHPVFKPGKLERVLYDILYQYNTLGKDIEINLK